MYDMHYDLLTILYFNLKKDNPLANKKRLIEDCRKIYQKGNIKGGVINLYFMSPKEMKEELGIEKYELENVSCMLQQSIQYLENFQFANVIPEDIDFIYSIEGCDFLKSEDDLEELYHLGIRSIVPVWNEKNKFGSGNRSESGLTEMGVKLIKKAIDLGMMIDVSHANVATFNDILDIVESEKALGKTVHIIASHSNVRSLCDRPRNLSDDQLVRLKNVDGYLGLFTNGNFLSLDNEQIDYPKRQENFMKHLDYSINKIGFKPDRIVVATDDMNFNPDSSYHHLESFPIETIGKDLRKMITNRYNDKIAEDILENNAKLLIKKLKYDKNNSYTSTRKK